MKQTLHETILNLSFKRGKRKAYSLQKESGGYREVSWEQYRDITLKLSAFLKSAGVSKGDRVLIYSENAPEWTMLVLAATNLGATAVPVAAIGSYLEVSNTIADAKPKVSFISSRVGASRQIQEFLQSEKKRFFVWDLQLENPLEDLLKNSVPERIHEGSEEDIALLIYTSGTTGNPKAVPISHKNLLSNASAVLKVVTVSDEERLVGVLPLSHVLEFTGGYLAPSLVGASITYVKSLKAEDLLQALRETRATIMIGVPLLFEIIGRSLKAKFDDSPWPLSAYFRWAFSVTETRPALAKLLFLPVHKALGGHIKFFMTGGSRLQPQTFEFFRSIGFPILQGYGLTETSPVITVTNLKTAAPDHVGLPLPGVSVGIFDDQGRQLPMGSEGEICALGPNVFRGYVKEEHNKGVFFGEWFRTGDLGTIDEAGFLRITGRKKDIIVTPAGKNVYPEEIESEIMATMKFLEVCVLGLQDAGGHEKIGLVLVPDRTKFPNLGFSEMEKQSVKIAQEACHSLADYKRPQKVEVLFQELPKTSTRKIKKHEVKKIILEKSATASATNAKEKKLDPDKPLEAAIASCIQEINQMDPGSIRLKDSLSQDLGFDSLTFVELIGAVEKKFGVKIDGVDFSSIQTIEDLVAALEFAAAPAKPERFWNRVYFTEFSPFDNAKFSWRLARSLVNGCLRMLLRSRHKLEVIGIEHLQPGVSYVFTPNHTSHFDLLSIASSLPANRIHSTFAVAAKDYFFNSTLKSLAARVFVNAIPFDRKGRVNESMDKCRDALSKGGSLVIFPEGTRSPDGSLQTFKPGVAQLLAGNGKVLAVPVYIDGAYAIMPKGSRLPKGGSLRVRYGKPVSFSGYSTDTEGLRKIAEALREEVQRLKV